MGVGRIALHHREVDGGAAAVARHGGDVVAKQRTLVQGGIVRGLGALVGKITRPSHEMRHGTRRAIAVEDLQALVLRVQVPLHACQRLGGGFEQEAFGREIAVHRRADEVVAAGVLDVLGDVGSELADIDQPGLLGGFRGG
ncbi:hypothetical protein CH75_22825 [Dyella jiangningensis]|nr:hypothetical protein CH75_22825 [Dyella jiangningensis]